MRCPHARRLPLSLALVLAGAGVAFLEQLELCCFVHPLLQASTPPRRRCERVGRAASQSGGLDVKDELLQLVQDEELQREVRRMDGKPMRGKIDEMIVALERKNQIEETALSYMLDGDWKLVYSGSFSPGIFAFPTRELALLLYGGGVSLGSALSSFAYGPFGEMAGLRVRNQRLSIDRGMDVRASADIEFLGQTQTISYEAYLGSLSSMRLEEEIREITLPDPIGRVDISQLPVDVDYRREMLVTYLDEDLMIVRDATGSAEVLMREFIDNYSVDDYDQSMD